MSGQAASCAVLGPRATAVAETVLQTASGHNAPPLLVCWGAGPTGRVGFQRRAVRHAAGALAATLPADWVVRARQRTVTVTVPPDCSDDTGRAIEQLVTTWEGPVAVAIGVPRCDVVDAVVRVVDEAVLVDPGVPGVTSIAACELQALGPVTVIEPPAPRGLVSGWRGGLAGDAGQSTVAIIAIVVVVIAVAAGLALVASALGRTAGVQGRADVAALAGAKALADGQLRVVGGAGAGMNVAEYRRSAIIAVERSARANGIEVSKIELLGDDDFPVQVRVSAVAPGATSATQKIRVRATAEVVVAALPAASGGAGDYQGPLAVRQGQRMRPDVAAAFDRMAAAARGAGMHLVITSGFRSDAEQAVLFARNPDPKWVAPPGKSLHRLGTELDLGPNSAWPWLAANAQRFGFLKRYSWEPWHFGYVRSAGSASLGYRAPSGRSSGEGGVRSAVPSFVPAQYAPMIAKAAQRWSVGAALLGAQLRAESNFNPNAVSGAGAGGIAQFMPGTAIQYGLTPAERFDPAKAINAQAHLMHDLLRQFGSVPLALAAYNAGPAPVKSCGCVPPYPETQAYVQKILAMLGGAGLSAAGGVQVRLVA